MFLVERSAASVPQAGQVAEGHAKSAALRQAGVKQLVEWQIQGGRSGRAVEDARCAPTAHGRRAKPSADSKAVS